MGIKKALKSVTCYLNGPQHIYGRPQVNTGTSQFLIHFHEFSEKYVLNYALSTSSNNFVVTSKLLQLIKTNM